MRVTAEADLGEAAYGEGPVLSHDSTRGGWVSFWFSDDQYNEVYPDPRLVSRYISADARPKHDSSTLFDAGLPVTAAYDPVADEHVLTTGASTYGYTGGVRRFSPMGEATGGPWKLEEGAMFPTVALDPRTGAGIVAYVLVRETEESFEGDIGIWVQRLAPGGGPQGAPVRVSVEGTKVDVHRAAVAFHPVRGEFAIAWRERRSGIGAYVGDIVVGRVPAGAGGPVGVPAAISDSRAAITAQAPGAIPDGAGAPGLAYDPATGGYLATWLGARGDVLEGPTQVYGQRLDSEVREVGADDFRISAGPGLIDFETFPTVVANDGMVVAWVRWIGDERQVVARRVTAGPPVDPALLWTSEEGLAGTPELVGPASGSLLLGIGADVFRRSHAQVRLLGEGPDPGSAQIASAPPATSASRTAAFGLEPGRPDGGLQCRLDDDAWRTCGRAHEETELSDRAHRLQVRAIGPDRWVQVSPAAARWRVEAGAPDTRITSSPEDNDDFARFSVAADEASTFECRFDDEPWSACSQSGLFAAFESGWVTDGLHRFEARAMDDAGHRDQSPAVWIWTVDTDNPETTIVDGPSGVTRPPGTFWFTSDEPGARFECSASATGNHPWTACESGVPYSTPGGQLYVRARDVAGNADGSPAFWQWSPDLSTPTVFFPLGNQPVGGVVTSRHAVMTFNVLNSGAGTTAEECRLDGGAWERCRNPVHLEGLADGSHAFAARTISRAGLVSPAETLQFTVDTHRPDTFVLAQPRSRTLVRSARIEFGARTDATFTCEIDSAAPQPCTSPLVLSGVALGRHVVVLRARGTGGWVEPTPEIVVWTVETDPNAPAPPGLRAAQETRSLAVAPPSTFFEGTPDKLERVNFAWFDWEWNEDDDVVSSECRLDGADWTPCETPHRLEGLSEGGHRFEARTVNSAGVRDPSPAAYEWTVDTITPRVLFQRTPRRRTNEQVVTVEFTADRAGATFECRGADTAWQPCTSPYTATGQPEGAYRLIVRAVNRGLISPTRTVNWIIDRTPADTVIDSARVSPGMTTSRRELAYTVRAIGHAAEESYDGYIEPEFYVTHCRVDGGPWFFCSGTPLTNLADGSHVVEARVTDFAGNVDATPARLDWTVDTRPADTAIDSGPAATLQTRSATFALRAVPAGGGFECRLDSGTWRACEATHTLTGVPDGSHTLEARATGGGSADATPARWLWTVDAEPTPVVLSGPPARTTAGTAVFRLASDDSAARIECRLDAGAWQTCGTDPVFTGLADGDHTLAVRAVDAGGRTGVLADPWRWAVDTQPPDTLLVSAPEPLRRWRDAELAFRSGDGGIRFQCRLDGGAWATCASPHRESALSNATHTMDARAIDAAGNVDPTPLTATWRVDTVLPSAQLTSSPLLGLGTKRTSATFTAGAAEAITTAECRIDGQAWAPCRDGVVFSGFTEGPHEVDARVTDLAGNVGYSFSPPPVGERGGRWTPRSCAGRPPSRTASAPASSSAATGRRSSARSMAERGRPAARRETTTP